MYPALLETGHRAIWSHPEHLRTNQLVLFLHDAGSTPETVAEHYFSLLPENTTGLALQAGFDATFGHSWFTTQDHQHESFPEVLSAAHRVFDALDDDEYGNTSYASVQAVGVGQGAALATTMLRVRPEAFSALVGINGYVIDNPMLAALDHPAGRDDATRVLWISDGQSDSPATVFSREWLAAHTRLTEAETTSAIAAFLAGVR